MLKGEVMPKNKWNIIWSGCYPGDSDEDEYGLYTKMNCERGVAERKNVEELSRWIDDMGLSYGEQGGSFRIHGGWIGSFKELKEGKIDFIPKDEIFRTVASWEEEKERGEKERKIWDKS